jgi:PAS domain S-box-containing protein
MQTGEHLLKTEALLDVAVDHMLDSLLILDWEGQILYANRAAATLVGVDSPAVGIGRNAAEFIHPDFLSAALEDLLLVREGRGGFLNQYKILRADGTEKWVEGLGTKINIQGGTANLLTLRDISTRKQIEAALQENVKQTEAILTQMVEGVITINESRIIEFFNPAAEKIFGYAVGEVVGKNISMLMPEPYAGLHDGYVRRYIETGEARIIGTGRDVMGLRKNGTLFPFHLSVGEVRLPQRRRFVGVVRDITDQKKAEADLRESEQRFRLLADSAPVLMWVADREGRHVFFNKSWLKFTGRTPEQEMNDGWAEGIHDEDREQVLSTYRDALSRRRPFSVEHRLRSQDGRHIWVLVRGVPRFDENGRFAGFMGTCTDIHELKTMEASLQELMSLKQAILDSANYSIISTTPDGIIRTFNAAAERWLGYSAGEVVGKMTPRSLHDHAEITAYAAELSQALGIEILPGFETFIAKARMGITDEREWTYIRKDGSRFPVLLSVTALRDRRGQITGFLGIGSDITARKRAEEQLQKLWQAVEQSPASVVITDLQGRIEYVNPKVTQITGYPGEELMGQNPRILKSGETPAEAYRQLWETITSGQEWRGVFHNRKKNGELYWESASISPVKDTRGQVTHFVAVKEDITAIREAEESLRLAKEAADAANRAKSDFLATMSHEIRTPMNAIIGMADLLWETAMTSEQRQYVQIFRSAGENLLDLINDILDISKVEAGHLSLEKTDFETGELIERACEIMAPKAHRKKIGLACRISPDIPEHLTGDPTRLRQVILNLIGNAIKFTERGEIMLEACLDQDAAIMGEDAATVRLHFSVRDTGIGIPEDKMDQIFERFTQVDASTTRTYGGSGLGLAISRRLVEMMNGRIWVESTPDKGSTFHFTAEFEPIPKARHIPRLNDADIQGRRILVVDDNATNRLILKDMLERWGARVTEAARGDEGLAVLKKAAETDSPFRLVILDQQMPVMDGFDVAREIQKDQDLAGMPLLMLTSEDRRGESSQARTLDISDYLVKPVKRLDLKEAVLRAMGRDAGYRMEPSGQTPGIESAPEATLQRPLKILLVDDSEDNRLLILAYLKKMPYAVEVAQNGAMAVEKVKKNSYDLILMDMQMPVMDGYSATREIRRWEREAGVEAPLRIIALTAHALKEDVEKSIEAGCDVHLTKPLKKAVLLETIRKYTTAQS